MACYLCKHAVRFLYHLKNKNESDAKVSWLCYWLYVLYWLGFFVFFCVFLVIASKKKIFNFSLKDRNIKQCSCLILKNDTFDCASSLDFM